MTTQSGVTYADQINGRRVVRGSVHLIDGQRIRFHAVRCYNKLYWTADAGATFCKSKAVALSEAKWLDVLVSVQREG